MGLSVNNNVVGVHAQEVAASAHAPVPADRGGRKLKQSKFSKSKSKTSKSSKTRRPRTSRPTPAPTNEPTVPPTDATTDAPTNAPTNAPTDAPTNAELDIPNKAAELGFSTLVATLTAADLVGALSNNRVIPMLNGESIVINIDNGGTVTINENSVVELANVMAPNGVIHAIDRVLVPPGLNIPEFLETCANAPTLGPTVQPTQGAACYDSSIRKCICDAESCTGALCEGQGPEFIWTNSCPVYCDPDTCQFPPVLDIPNKAKELGFGALVAALTAADLVGALSNPPNQGPFTVMAPTNEAFDLLGDTLLGCLLLPRYVEVLQTILLYHVANGLVLAKDLSNDQVIPMLNGESIVINIDNGGTVTINENSVVEIV